MEILFITHKYPPSIGGMENQSYALVQGMRTFAKVHCIFYDIESQSKLWFFLTLKKRVRAYIKSNPNIDIIHVNDGLLGLFCAWIKKEFRIPLSVTIHGLDIVFPLPFFQKRLIQRLQKYDSIIGVSSATRDECLKRNFDPDKVIAISNGVDADNPFGENIKNPYELINDTFSLDLKGRRTLVTMGRSVKRKGFSWFIREVLPLLDDRVHFVIIGPFNKRDSFLYKMASVVLGKKRKKYLDLLFGYPSDEKDIQKLQQDDTLNHRFTHLGKLQAKQVAAIYKIADAFIMPNIKMEGDFEGFGLVALEASVAGLPVITSGIEGISDAVIDKKNGIHVKEGNGETWKQVIHSFLEDGQKLEEMSIGGKRYTLQNYSWEKMVKNYLLHFKEVISKYTTTS